MKRSINTNQETKETVKKWNVMKTAPGVATEVKRNMHVLILSRSHGCRLPNSIGMFRIFSSRLLLAIDYYRLLSIFVNR